MADIKYDIVEEVGVVSESSTGWTKELNLISWNNREAKYDLRDWAPDHAKMGKGITLSIDELRQLKNLLNNIYTIISNMLKLEKQGILIYILNALAF